MTHCFAYKDVAGTIHLTEGGTFDEARNKMWSEIVQLYGGLDNDTVKEFRAFEVIEGGLSEKNNCSR